MEIKMIPFTENYVIPEDGKYLVRTTSKVLGNVNHFQARCQRRWDDKKQKGSTKIDVNNQIVTHISEQPLK